MPKLLGVDASVAAKTMHGFDYTSIAVDRLGASEYTVVGIVTDKTLSVQPFKTDLEKMIGASVGACRESARALNLLIRTTAFNSSGIEELHGFTLLNTIDPDAYVDTIHPSGSTNLFSATLDAVEATDEYVQGLFASESIVNANSILFIITDGDDNASPGHHYPEFIKEAIEKVKQSEVMESIYTILIGVNDTDSHFQQKLEQFRIDANIDEYISMGEVTEKKLAKLGKFVSQSITSTSKALGSGQSQPIDNFTF